MHLRSNRLFSVAAIGLVASACLDTTGARFSTLEKQAAAIAVAGDNVFPSPMPPGALAPEDAPQIIVMGFDDCMFTGDHPNDLAKAPDNGMRFVAALFEQLKNPDGSVAHGSFYPNGAYLPNTEVGGPWGSETSYTPSAYKKLVSLGFEMGNHTFDHLEINGTWGRIPTAWKTGSLGGWADSAGTKLPQDVWESPVVSFNDQLLRQSIGVAKIYGFKAPRLEINGPGLAALKSLGYLYDASLEEGHQQEYISAAVLPGTDQRGFKWIPWPYTLDNGSPGVWQSQDYGEKDTPCGTSPPGCSRCRCTCSTSRTTGCRRRSPRA